MPLNGLQILNFSIFPQFRWSLCCSVLNDFWDSIAGKITPAAAEDSFSLCVDFFVKEYHVKSEFQR